MSRDYIRLGFILFAGLLIGLLIEHVASTLLVACLGYILWQRHKLSGLLDWIQNKKILSHRNNQERLRRSVWSWIA